jgi:dTDP-4-amino-4,6-dideoxygalactose transaminase
MGDRVAAFEHAFSRSHGAAAGVAVSSCTAGLHLSLRALGVGAGDEVLVPSLTFVATVNAVLYVGATPVFVDIESHVVPHMSLSDAAAKISPRTKAAIVMHYGGYLVDELQWSAFRERYRIDLIEDAAHAAGVDGVGRLGDVAVFSFFSNKNMTTAEGGMIFCQDEGVLARVRAMRSHGMTSGTLDRHRGHAFGYDVTMLGYNYRMDELRAAIGLVQLSHLTEWNRRRKYLTNLYRELLSLYCPQILLPFDQHTSSAYHLAVVILPKTVLRDEAMRKLSYGGVQTSVHYVPVHRFSFYRERHPSVSLPITEDFADRVLTLPLFPSLRESEVEHVVKTLAATIS